ncbi:TSUP family transporter [Agilicoccus flavus]|uniref:TSUP family transporter n=1 Tax=Agilicoccus flavus TaxID=2775968 RepID=UPI001CF65D82|nr:TSUP family transporter [Agilicoccus flavus]
MPPDLLGLAVTCGALVAATIAQRVVGMGFGIIMAPVVAIVAGPLAAVLVVNLYVVVACGLMLPRVWPDVDWRRLRWLIGPAAAASVAGLWIARSADVDVLRVAVGVAALLGVGVSVAFAGGERVIDGPVSRVVAGATIGLMNASVALGAPPVAVYSIVSRWERRSFAATMQPFWVALSLVTLLERQVLAPGGAPDWPWWGWGAAGLATVAGVLAAEPVARRVSARAARLGVIGLSLASGLAVTAVGVAGLTG